MVELNGTELTIEQVMAVARHEEQVRISEPAKQKIDRARAYVDEKAFPISWIIVLSAKPKLNYVR